MKVFNEAYSLSFTGCEFAPASTAYGALKSANTNGTITLRVTECEFISVPNKAAINADPNTIITASDSAFVDCAKGWIKGDAGTTVNGTAIESHSAEEVIALLKKAGCIDEPLPEPVVEEKGVNFFLFMFMKRLLTEYAVELVYDDTMGIVEVDDEDGYVRFSKDAVITVAALEGYEVESVLVNGKAVALDEDGAYTIKRIRKDAKVEVTFSEIVEEEIEDAE